MIEREDIAGPTTLLRIFSDGQHHGDKYVAVLTLKWIDNTTVEACGFHGNMETSLFKELEQWFIKNNITKVLATRHGKQHQFNWSI